MSWTAVLPTILRTIAIGVLLAGCAVGPNYVPPHPDVPDRWHQEIAEDLAGDSANLHRWWDAFDDSDLTSLIDRAYRGNRDLRIAAARVRESIARRAVARGEFFPEIEGLGSWQYERSNEELLQLPGGFDRTRDVTTLGLDSSWEIDLFGRIRRSVEAAEADVEAAMEDYRDLLVVLFAEVARAYVDVRTLQKRVRYAQDNARLQGETLELTRDRTAAGLAPDLDARQAELNLASTQALIPRLEIGLYAAMNRLAVLLGEFPSALYDELGGSRPIPEPEQSVLVGVPADLLRQRPDVRRAERELAAQTARIGVATADLYPRFALLGSFAFAASDIARLFTGDAFSYGLGPAFRWNLFQGGRIRANIRVQDALTEQALERYEQSVLLALEEVENAMISYVKERKRRDALTSSVEAAAESVRLVKTLYVNGLTEFLNVLQTERDLFEQQDAQAESEGQVARNLIAIYETLGGGWKPVRTASPDSSPESD